MKSLSNTFSYATIGSLGLIGIALCIFPGAPLWSSLFQMLGILVITLFVYRKVCPETAAGRWILLAVWTILGIGFAANVWYFTTYSGGTLEDPVLYNDDASKVWKQLILLRNGLEFDGIRMARYALLISWIECGSTPTINSLIMNNILVTLLTIVITGAFTAQICGDNDLSYRRKISTLSMGLISAVCYFVASGVIIIKDAPMCLTMASILYALSLLTHGNYRYRPWILLVIFIPIAWLVRPNLIPFIFLAILIFAPFIQRNKWYGLCGIIILLGLLFIESKYNCYTPDLIKQDGTSLFDIHTGDEPRLAAYETISPNYESLNIWQRLIRMPFSLVVQFLTPLPWAFTRDIVFGPSMIYAHISYPWYLIGGIVLFYIFRCLFKSPRLIAASVIFGLCATMATAFVTGGTVSRYCLLWLPALIPGASWVIASGRWRKKDFKIWSIVYITGIILGLIIVFAALNIYSPGGWTAK